MKYYAVKTGRVPGIYKTWSECQKQTQGYPCTVFKSFISKDEAEDFIKDKNEEKQKIYNQIAYTDGSYKNVRGRKMSGGGVYFTCGDLKACFGICPKNHTNNRGELYGVFLALKYGEKYVKYNGRFKLKIMIDSEYAHHTVTKEWKAKNNLDILKDIWKLQENMDVDFKHIYGHSNDQGNDLADTYANEGAESSDNLIHLIMR
jgi:viroplasmin and RNaseH domain-containing protein